MRATLKKKGMWCFDDFGTQGKGHDGNNWREIEVTRGDEV